MLWAKRDDGVDGETRVLSPYLVYRLLFSVKTFTEREARLPRHLRVHKRRAPLQFDVDMVIAQNALSATRYAQALHENAPEFQVRTLMVVRLVMCEHVCYRSQ